MNIDDVVNRAIPIYDKDCAAGKCERDCRLSIDYKKGMRVWLKKQMLAYAQSYAASEMGRSYVQRLEYDKK